MAQTVGDIIQRYSDDCPSDPRVQLRGISIKINLESMILLEALADHIGKKKTPLMGEIAEAAIHEVYDSLCDEIDPQRRDFFERRISMEVQNV